MIDFRILGRMELTGPDSGGTDASALLSQPKPTALFAYLLLARPGVMQRRDALAAMLWPESDQKRARGALSQTLYVIRRHLGSAVLVTRGTEDVGIATERVQCDALEFRRLLDAGAREEALDLYGGELLPSFYLADTPAFEHWLETERAKLRRLAVEAAWIVADEAEAAGDAVKASRWSRWAVRTTPHDEAALRRMMEMMDRLGDRSGAMAEFERYRKRLMGEMELEPESETSVLALRIASAGKRGEGPPVPAGGDGSGRRTSDSDASTGDTEPARDDFDDFGRPTRARVVLRRVREAVVALVVIVGALTVVSQLVSRPPTDLAFGTEVPSVAVLPISGERQLSEGITRRLIEILQRTGFQTQSYMSVSRYVDSAGVSTESLGERLRVKYVVSGSVSQTDDRFELNASLADARDGFELLPWTFIDSPLKAREIEWSLAREIINRITDLEGLDPTTYRIKRYTESALADSLYRTGQRLSRESYNVATSRRAQNAFRSAIEADPDFAPAYVELASGLFHMSRIYWEAEPIDQVPEVLELLLSAQRLAPELASTHTALGWYSYGFDRDYDEAIEHHVQAIRIAPNRVQAYMAYAFPLAALGMGDSALAMTGRARELEPMNPMVVSTHCWMQYLADRLADAIETCEFLTDSIDASFRVANDIKGVAMTTLMARNGDSAGLAERLRILKATPEPPVDKRKLYQEIGDPGNAWEWATVGDTTHALAILEEEKVQPGVRPLRIAIGYAAAGAMDTAFVWLDRAIESRDPFVPEINVRPEMEPFRRDARFPAYLNKLGLNRPDQGRDASRRSNE